MNKQNSSNNGPLAANWKTFKSLVFISQFIGDIGQLLYF